MEQKLLNCFVDIWPDGIVHIECLDDDILDIESEGRTLKEAKRNFEKQLPAEFADAVIVYRGEVGHQYQELMLRAIDLASTKHLSQTDKAGKPYLGHVARVSHNCERDEERIVGLMHDLIEDTDVTARQLLDEGFPAEIVDAVVAVTRRDGEDYAEFIERAAMNPIARRVKIADLLDNMDVTRLATLTDEDCQRLKKYHRSWRRLAFNEPQAPL